MKVIQPTQKELNLFFFNQADAALQRKIEYWFLLKGRSAEANELLLSLWNDLAIDNKEETQQAFESFKNRLQQERKRAIQRKINSVSMWFQRSAAVLILPIISIALYFLLNTNPSGIALQTITAPAGQRINIKLSDGTVIWLNSRTSIEYPAIFCEEVRKIKLNGEAYFEVTHNKSKPFIVETTKGNIEVLGTKFYVEAYPENNNFITSLIEGSVKVNCGANEILLKPTEMAVLQNGKLAISTIDDYNTYRWREGLICFRKMAFKDIMAKFEKSFGTTITLENPKYNDILLTGKFRESEGLEYALKILQKDINFLYNLDKERNSITIQ